MRQVARFSGNIFGWTLVLALAGGPGAGARAADEVRVITGDTLELGGVAYRLAGIVAPDLDQTCRWKARTIKCGAIARTAMMDLVAGATVVCRPVNGPVNGDQSGTDDGGTARLAACRADGFDIGSNMVHTGWALAAPGPESPYRAVEAKARAAGRGLWRGEFVKPWDRQPAGKP